jgi:hypothetical protein
MKRIWSLILVAMLGSMLVSCGGGKGAATIAIQAAETAWTAARDNVAKLLPDDAKSMDEAIAAAKASLEQGDVKAALASAKELPARIQQLTAGLAAKEAELRGAWSSLDAGLPGVVSAVQKRVDILSKSKKLPAGIEQAAFDGAKSSLAQAKQMWAEAQSAQQNGNLGEAVTKASGVKELLGKVLTALKMPVPAALQS